MSAQTDGVTPRIVAGVDGSPSSIHALRWAVKQAELTGASVDAVIAWQYPIAAGGFGWAPSTLDDNTDYAELAAKALNGALADVELPAAVKVRQIVQAGNPAQVLLAAAKGAALLVVGNRGHGGFTEALLGSVSQRCVHHAQCPVVVVHTAKAPA